MAKKWLLRLLALTMALVMLMCLCAWCIDPYMLYRVRDNQYLLNSRLVTPGLIKNYDYDTVLIGSSMIQNTDMQRFRDTLGGKPLKITTGAISLTEIQKLTDKIGELGKAEHYYICLDQYLFAPEKWDDMDRFPDYLMTTPGMTTGICWATRPGCASSPSISPCPAPGRWGSPCRKNSPGP